MLEGCDLVHLISSDAERVQSLHTKPRSELLNIHRTQSELKGTLLGFESIVEALLEVYLDENNESPHHAKVVTSFLCDVMGFSKITMSQQKRPCCLLPALSNKFDIQSSDLSNNDDLSEDESESPENVGGAQL